MYNLSTDILNGVLNKNKLTYYVHQKEGFYPETTVALVVKAGSMMEKEYEQGLSHFIEHMCAGSLAHCNVINGGGYNYAYTNFYETVYLFTQNNSNEKDDYNYVSDCIKAIMKILSGCLLNTNFLDIARNEICNEISTSYSDKFTAIKKLFEADFGKVNLPIGDALYISKFQTSDLVEYHKKWYSPDNAAVIVISSIEPSKIIALISNLITPVFSQDNTITITNNDNYTSSIDINTEILDTNSSKVFLISKHKRELISLENYIEYSICLNIALDMIAFVAEDYFAAQGFDCKKIDASIEIFSYDIYLVRFSINANVYISNNDLENLLKKIEISESIYNKIKEKYVDIKNSNTQMQMESRLSVVLNECVQNFLFDEPIIDVDEEINYISLSIEKTNYEMVKMICRNIIENIVRI